MELCGSAKNTYVGYFCLGSHSPLEETKIAGVEELMILDTYLAVLAITLLFTILAIFRRTAVLDGIAWICWWASAACHLLASPTTTPLYIISILWGGFGFIFLILMFKDVWKMYDFRKNNIDWMDEEL